MSRREDSLHHEEDAPRVRFTRSSRQARRRAAKPSQPAVPPQSARLSPRACDACGRRDGLTWCGSCRVVWYCGEHKGAVLDSHADACDTVCAARQAYEDGETRVEASYLDMSNTYRNASHRYTQLLLDEFGSTDGAGNVTGRIAAVEAALEHMLCTLRHYPMYRLHSRAPVPALYLALDRDQEAYDFVKWYATAEEWYATANDTDDADGENPSPRHLNLKNSDVLEGLWHVWTHDPDLPLIRNSALLSHVVAVLLIKVRAYLDLVNLQNAARSLAGTLPAEIIDLIRLHLPRGALSSRRDVLRLDVPGTAAVIEDLKLQMWGLWRAARQRDMAFWDRMLGGGGAEDMAGTESSDGNTSPAFMRREREDLEQRCQVTPWLVTPGALGVVRVLRRSYFGYRQSYG